MKKKILLSVVSFSLAVGAGAHDDLIYRTQAGWNFDIGNQSVISQTLDAVFTGIPFSDMNKDAKTDDFVVVQGIIDVYFEEEDKIILVDYKTDRVREGEEDILIRRYRAQMESYQQALEKITGKCVKEIYIYSVTLQKTIPVHV